EPSVGIFDPESREQIKTSYENFQLARKKHANRPCLGHRPIAADGTAGPYVWSTYEQVGKRAENFGSGLVHMDLCPSRPDPEVRDRGMLGRGPQAAQLPLAPAGVDTSNNAQGKTAQDDMGIPMGHTVNLE
ncbi:Acsl5, partial [Symbiodinium pilosum]